MAGAGGQHLAERLPHSVRSEFVLTALLLFSLPLWQTPADAGAGEEFTPEHRTISELLKVPVCRR